MTENGTLVSGGPSHDHQNGINRIDFIKLQNIVHSVEIDQGKTVLSRNHVTGLLGRVDWVASLPKSDLSFTKAIGA